MRFVLLPLQAVVVASATVIVGIVILGCRLAGRPVWAYGMVRWWCRVLHFMTGTRYEARGLDNVPDGPYVVISNHSSHLDGPGLIVAMPHPIYFVIKKGLAQIPVWGWAATGIGFIAIDRARSREAKEALNGAIGRIRDGDHILVFAEGTRSPDFRLHRFKKGGFHLAAEAGVPILPVAVNGSGGLLPKGSLTPRPGRVTIIIGEPIPTTGADRDDISDVMAKTRRAIREARRLDPDFIDDED